MSLDTADSSDPMEVVEAFFSEPWPGGLAVVPPTVERVKRMVGISSRFDPQQYSAP